MSARTYWFVLLAGAALFGIQHIAFFADDYIFLDAARRMPADRVLLGQYGIYPWYRPLARELYFYGAILAGPAARVFTVALSALTAAAATWCLYRIGEELGCRRGGALAAVLFLTHNLTRFLTAWASGYQDLLSVCLVLWAVYSQLRGRGALALALAMLAPFAKETGIVAFPLLYVAERLGPRARPILPFLLRLVGGGIAVVVIHLLVRSTWTGGGSSLVIATSAVGLATATGDSLRWFLSIPSQVSVLALAAAVAGLVGFWGFTSGTREAKEVDTNARWSRLLLPLAGAALGLSPLIVGNIARLSVPKVYYAYPAIPWIALLAGLASSILIPRWTRVLAGALLVVNIVGLFYRAPDLDRRESWISGAPSWWEAVRVSSATERFRDDLRRQFPSVPPGTVILYTRFPTGSFFMQSDDGATTRELLGKRDLKAFYISEAPSDLDLERAHIVAFDAQSHHLRLLPRDWGSNVVAGMQRLLVGEPQSALLRFRYGRPAHAAERSAANYLRLNAAICLYGPAEILNRMRIAPGLDSLNLEHNAGIGTHLVPAGEPGLVRTQLAVLAAPLSAPARRALADSLFAHELPLQAGVETRVAAALVPPTSRDYYFMGLALVMSGAGPLARPELEKAITAGSPVEYAVRASELLSRLPAGNDNSPSD